MNLLSQRLVISTGAGISVASGIQAFRGPGGLWTENPELEAKSNRDYIDTHLDEFSDTWTAVRDLLSGAEPNKTHLLIAEAQKDMALKDDRLTCITQNVDNLLTKAGVKDVIELHGNLFKLTCASKCWRGSWEWTPTVEKTCPMCDGPSRPDIIAFGEDIKPSQIGRASGACLVSTHFIAVGTSGTVYPASELVSIAKSSGARTTLVNLQEWEYPHPDFDETFIGDCSTILEEILVQHGYI